MEPDGPSFPWAALIGLVPHLVWAAVILIVLRWIGVAEVRLLLARLKKIGAAGLGLEFHEKVQAAVEARGHPTTPQQLGRVARRLAASGPLVQGAQILWVDDEPDNNHLEARPLQDAGATIVFARSTREAIDQAQRMRFDLVISDIVRGNDASAGLHMTRELAASGLNAPVIFYVGQAKKPVPADAFGITDRPDELLHLVLDALARRRG